MARRYRVWRATTVTHCGPICSWSTFGECVNFIKAHKLRGGSLVISQAKTKKAFIRYNRR